MDEASPSSLSQNGRDRQFENVAFERLLREDSLAAHQSFE